MKFTWTTDRNSDRCQIGRLVPEPTYRAWLRKRGNQARLRKVVERLTDRCLAQSTVSRWATGDTRPDACAEALIMLLEELEEDHSPDERHLSDPVQL